MRNAYTTGSGRAATFQWNKVVECQGVPTGAAKVRFQIYNNNKMTETFANGGYEFAFDNVLWAWD